MDGSMANGTLSCDPNTGPACVRPVDGFGGSLYRLPFSIPSYDSSNVNPTTSLYNIDRYHRSRAVPLFMASIGLGLCILTVANILVLTPSHKRKFLHHVLLIGNIAQIIRCSTNASLLMTGYLASAYTTLTNDWASSVWSPAFRAVVMISDVSICVSFGCAEIAFYSLSHGMLAWLRLKFHVYVYYSVVSAMVFVSLFAYLWRVVMAVDEIRFIAFQPQGDFIPRLVVQRWYVTLEGGGKILLGISLGLWSIIFAVSAGIIIWQRRQALFWSEDRGSGDMGSLSRKMKKVKNGYEKALRVLGIVAVESFIIPVVLCSLNFVSDANNINSTDSLIVPTILSLLPVLSLFNGGNLKAEPEHSDISRRNQDQGTRSAFEVAG